MKRYYLYLGIFFGVIFLPLFPAMAKTEAVVGVPIIQARLSMETSHNVNLDNNQKLKNRLLITKEEDTYFWETRDRRELTYKKMKNFDLFIDPSTGGYIKIVKQPDGRYVYIEHISIPNLKGFTYWGVINLYDP